MLAARFSGLPQILKNSGRPVNSVTGLEGRTNQTQETRKFLRTIRNRYLQPRVVTHMISHIVRTEYKLVIDCLRNHGNSSEAGRP